MVRLVTIDTSTLYTKLTLLYTGEFSEVEMDKEKLFWQISFDHMEAMEQLQGK